ncbi:toxin-antitoxin system YwqK family antitoxin [Tenacibaculum agarivorans]|uniref:toxin-antitoxin system YwqK family antitoxin n=1 Tax=Tenacibaculum agarivorans TaxID=1908389 RepID=UPI00094B9A4E|nr:toxin-antitoxin system YwqK family antitoxin [Tenacibaculum agarivorans]
MIKARVNVVLSFVFTMLFSLVISAQKVNQVDADGKRDGIWRKYYSNGDIRYEGEFRNGKEIGRFLFYNRGSSYPSIVKDFAENSDIATVKFYNKSRVKTEGQMKGKQRIGKWTYYFTDGTTVFSEENYENGQLHGMLKNYYMNGKLTEESEYSNGKKHGVSKIYSEDGVLIEEVHFVNGLLDGEAKYFDLKGVIKEKGKYKDNKRIGKWEYYIDGEVSDKGKPRKNMLKGDKLQKEEE